MVQRINPRVTQPILLWDSKWNVADGSDEFDSYGDWAISGSDLERESVLHTAVIQCLFTDKRCPDDRELPGDVDNRRGWFGDFVDIRPEEGEQEMGSLIWLYERSALTDDTAEGVRVEAIEALQPLLEQGLCALIDVDVEVNKTIGAITLIINIFSEAGDVRYSQRFERVWRQTHG